MKEAIFMEGPSNKTDPNLPRTCRKTGWWLVGVACLVTFQQAVFHVRGSLSFGYVMAIMYAFLALHSFRSARLHQRIIDLEQELEELRIEKGGQDGWRRTGPRTDSLSLLADTRASTHQEGQSR